jgi:flagellar M-ring protein FliF
MAEEQSSTMNRFEQLSAQQKMGLAVGVALIIALTAGLWLWGQSPEYRVLYSNLSDRDGGAIIESLQQLNIPYKFTEGGGALMVPANNVYEARLKLASQGLPKGGTVGFELMENQKFGITQFAEQVNYQRALEGELARSVQSIGSVASARVHLAIPKPSVFVKEQQKPSASVVLTLHGGRLLDEAQVSAIVHLISSSVPEMAAKSVTVVDQSGTLLSAMHDPTVDGLDSNQLKYIQQVEQNYIRRIEDILTPLLGADNVHAQVTANIDFSRIEQTAEIFKPNQNPKDSSVRSLQSVETLNGSGLTASGVPGALTNQPPVPATAPIVMQPGDVAPENAASINNLHKESTTNYEVDRTIRHTLLPVGAIKRLSAAVVVNNRKSTDAKGKVSIKPLSDAENAQIDALVRDAMGFDRSRGDTVNVQVATFLEEKEVVAEIPFWKQPEMMELGKELTKYLLIAAVTLILVFGVIKPAFRPLRPPEKEIAESAIESAEAAEAAAGYTPSIPPYEQNLQIARQIAQQEPKIVASVIKEWVSGNE